MKKISFNISARTAKLIGQENFANAEGAVIELVKNCYDADATACVVFFVQSENSLYIIDDGEGMTEKIIEDYWMTIGTGNKSLNAKTTGKERVKTGAKGIGRFALDRLGQNCQMITTTELTSTVEWQMSWNQFEGAVNLTDVQATIQTKDDLVFKDYVAEKLSSVELPAQFFEDHFKKDCGTSIKISGLHDKWEPEQILELFQNLEQLIPPLETSSYSLYLFSEDTFPENELFEIGQVKPAPFTEYDYMVEAKAEADSSVCITIYRKELDVNALKERHFFTKAELKGNQYSEAIFEAGKFEIHTSLAELVPGVKAKDTENRLGKIGPFKFDFLFLKRGGVQDSEDQSKGFPYKTVNYAERSRLLAKYGGIKLFRDNFRVRPYGESKSTAFDWLELGIRAAQSPTITKPGYRVRPNQVYGVVSISRLSNLQFQDKSNREGIQENSVFSLFKEILLAIINKFELDRNQIMMAVKQVNDLNNPQEQAKESAADDINRYKQNKARRAAKPKSASGSKSTPPPPPPSSDELLHDADKVIDTSELAIKALKEEITDLRNEQKLYRVLASTGLTVASFAHELKNLGGMLVPRSDYLRDTLEQLLDPAVLADLDDFENPFIMLADMRSDDERVSQWLSFALSSLRKDKRKRVTIDLVDYIDRLQRKWSALLAQKRVTLLIKKSYFTNVYFTGFEIDLDSIFNNLISNSAEAFFRPDAPKERVITLSFSLSASSGINLVYEDSGPGLDSEIVDIDHIFQPFFTTKRDPNTSEETGTGLGLWLVKSIVDDYKGTVQLAAKRPGFQLSISLPAR